MIEKIGSNFDKEALDKLLNFATTIENSVKHQNLQLRNEMDDLKQQIAKLQEGKGDRNEYDSIQTRLSQLKIESRDLHPNETNNTFLITQNYPIEQQLTEPSARQSKIDTGNKIEPVKAAPKKDPVSPITKQKHNSQHLSDKKNIDSSKIDQKPVNSMIIKSNETLKSSKVDQSKDGGIQNILTNNSESQRKGNIEPRPDMEKILKQLHPRDPNNFSLKKDFKGIKRSIRTGEEEFYK